MYHSPQGSEREQDEEDEVDVRPPPRKRRKVTPPTRSTLLGIATRRQIRSNGGVSRPRQVRTSFPSRKRSGRQYIRHLPSSQHSSSEEGTAHIPMAEFGEWPLKDAVLKRAMVNGLATFQLQFTWVSCTNPVHNGHTAGLAIGGSGSNSLAGGGSSTKQGPRTRVAFMPGENALSSQTDNNVQAPALTEEETEWEVEKILGTRKRGRGNQVLVKWTGSAESTWEPLTNFLETEALNAYEMQHGKIVL
jgi:hypothetical protein